MKKYNYIKPHMRNSTHWDEEETLSCPQKLIKHNYNQEYDDTDTRLKVSNEAEFLNEIKPTKCQQCFSNNIIKNGKYKTGFIRYLENLLC